MLANHTANNQLGHLPISKQETQNGTLHHFRLFLIPLTRYSNLIYHLLLSQRSQPAVALLDQDMGQ